ncbi:MAG: site-2 protease family protein [Thermodesulfovibrionales bacterium]|nr:site-2 protease family protein [Thermodesulfovibrionales bacterium]
MRRLTYLHILLFTLTAFSTLVAGAMQRGVNPLKEPFRLYEGLPFSFTLMLILLSHELSHYFASRRHNTEATLPYFIPAPSIIGTFGAFIKMKSPIQTRSALIDIGASGPIVGFVVSFFASVAGLAYSKVIAVPSEPGALGLGDSVLFSALSRVILGVPPEGHDILLHPVAFAGWIGFFVTSLNLIPIGQLDGGHIAYAFFGRFHRFISITLVGVLAVLGLVYWEGWLLWSVLMLVLGFSHPPVVYWEMPLEPGRRLVGALSFFIFLITFIPMPFYVAG